MAMNNELINQLGDELYNAFVSQTTLVPFTEQFPDISLEDAYRIQQRFIQCRLDAGESGCRIFSACFNRTLAS